MELVRIGMAGALLRWPRGAAPGVVDLFSNGVHFGRAPVIRFDEGQAPIRTLFDAARVPDAMNEVEVVEGPTTRVGWGPSVGEDWSVTGEQTPFTYRETSDDYRVCRFDLTAAGGLAGFTPAPGQRYWFGVHAAQHRCGMGVSLEWLDRRERVLHRDDQWRETGPWGGRDPNNYAALGVSGVCPPNATRVRLVIMQGPPVEGEDAYVFFRLASLTEQDPAGRTLVRSDSGLEEGAGDYALVPVGDAARQFGGELSLADGADRVELGSVAPEGRTPMVGVSAVCNGSVLDVELSGEAAGEVCVAVDGGFRGVHPAGAAARVSVRLPATLLDGERHWVEVRWSPLGETLFAGEVVFPALQTPAEVLQRYTSRIERPGLIPFAALRYEALAASLERLGRSGVVDPEQLRTVSQCHQYVLGGPQPDAKRFAVRQAPEVDAPVFSIIIPVHNKFYFTYFCVNAILYTAAGLPFEIVVVDDGSSDRTATLEEVLPGVRVVRNEQAGGFVQACNAGAAAARGDFLLFLNNDTEVVGRWLEELRLPFQTFAGVGATGAKLVFPDGRLQEAGGIIWANGRPWNGGRDGNPMDPSWSYSRQADYLSGAALMVSRAVWDEVGGFSREFEPAYYEDTDLCFKIRDAGYRTVLAAKALIVHYEGVSNGTSTATTTGLKRFQEINRPKFEAKWRRAFRLAAPEGVNPLLEKDRGQIGRALVLDYQSPRFDKDAGSYAISQEIRLLQGLGYKVTVATLNCAHLGMYTEAFERGGVEHLYSPFFSSLNDVIERRGREFSLVYIHRYTTAEGLVGLIRRCAPDAKVLLNCADLHFLRELRAARIADSADAFDRAMRTRESEIAVFGEVDAVMTYSDVERAIVETYLGMRAKVHVLPWVAPAAAADRPLAARDGIGFIGSFDHPPNRDAVEWFIDQCWPALAERFPDLILHVAGSGFERFVPPAGAERVEVSGWVESSADFLGARRVMVAPMRSGAGIKGKVIDAFNAGTPAVLSPVAAETIISGARNKAIARTPADWIDRVSVLLTDDELWAAEARAGRERIEDQFSFDNGLQVMGRILESVELPTQPVADDSFFCRVPYSDIGRLLASPVLESTA